MKKIIIYITLFIALSLDSESGIDGSLKYSYNQIDDYILASINFGRETSIANYGAYDGFKLFNITSGIRLKDDKINYAYDFSIFTYLAIFKIPLKPIFNTEEYPNMDSHDLNDGPTYLTLSYKGPEVSNLGIYKKDYNWSSIGVDFLYKNFNWNQFYTRFSYIVTASTIQNNLDYFSGVDVTDKTKLCFDMKIKNSTNLLVSRCVMVPELKLESYYRIIFNEFKQKEFGANFVLNYPISYDGTITTQIGYIYYGVNNNWKNLFKCGLGFSYLLYH